MRKLSIISVFVYLLLLTTVQGSELEGTWISECNIGKHNTFRTVELTFSGNKHTYEEDTTVGDCANKSVTYRYEFKSVFGNPVKSITGAREIDFEFQALFIAVRNDELLEIANSSKLCNRTWKKDEFVEIKKGVCEAVPAVENAITLYQIYRLNSDTLLFGDFDGKRNDIPQNRPTKLNEKFAFKKKKTQQ